MGNITLHYREELQELHHFSYEKRFGMFPGIPCKFISSFRG